MTFLFWHFFPHDPASALASVRPAVFRCSGNIWPISQLLVQRRTVHLQCPGGATHSSAMETPPDGQQGHVLRQPVPGLLLPQLCYPRPGAVPQVEDGHRGLRRQHRWEIMAFCSEVCRRKLCYPINSSSSPLKVYFSLCASAIRRSLLMFLLLSERVFRPWNGLNQSNRAPLLLTEREWKANHMRCKKKKMWWKHIYY